MDERTAKELHIGEELLWEDTPGVSDILNVSNVITMPIGFMMCFFAIHGIVLPDTHWKIRILLFFLLYVGLQFSVCVIVYKILNDKTGDRGNIQPSPLDVFSDK